MKIRLKPPLRAKALERLPEAAKARAKLASTGWKAVQAQASHLQGTLPVTPVWRKVSASLETGDNKDPVFETADRTRENELSRRLSVMARTLGRDARLKVEPGNWWAYHFDSNKITYPIKDMLAHGDGYNMGVICHELSHRLYSRVPEHVDNKSFHYLWNAIEDIRINKVISKRFAGVPGYMRELYTDFTSADAEKEAGLNRPRAQQFALAHIYEWAAGKKGSPIAVAPEVKAALDESRKYVEEATRVPDFLDLRFGDLTPEEATQEALHSYRVIREKVWPIYERLLQQDIADPAMKEKVKKLNEEAAKNAGQEGTPKSGEPQAGKPGATEKGEKPEKTDGKTAKPDDAKAAAPDKAQKDAQPVEGGKPDKAEGEGAGAGEPQKGQGGKPGKATGEGEGAGEPQKGQGGKPGKATGEGEGAGEPQKGQGGKPGKAKGKGAESKPDKEDGQPGEKATSGRGNESSGVEEDGTISTHDVPYDPLKHDGKTPEYDETRKELEELFARAAKELETRIPGEDAPAAVSEADANRRKGNLDELGSANVSLEDQLKALNERMLQAGNARPPPHAYAAVARQYQREIDLMVSEISNALERDDLPQLRGHFRAGQYDLKKALQSEFQRQATGRADPKVFLKRDEPVERKTEIIFCVDISGSMQGANIAAAREAYVVFQEALARLGIANATVAYNGKAFPLSQLEKPTDDAARLAAFNQLVAGGDNNEPAALATARQMFEGSNANNKVVLFLTDGGAVANAKSYVEQTERETDIKVIGIGIGAGVGEVRNIFPKNHLVVPNVGELAKAIGQKLQDLLLENGG